MASPTPRSGIGVVPTAAQGRYATQGMISPVEPPFVEPATGALTPVSFRFLYGLFRDIQTLQAGGGGGGTVGPPGPQGPPGPTGPAGSPGSAATVNVGTTSTGAPGTPADVTNSGSTSAAIFNFTVPAGVQGATGSQGPQGNPGAAGPAGTAATIAAGTTTTGAPGSSASVTNSGTSSAAVFDFTIPQGQTGAAGSTGSQGPPGNTGPAGTAATVNVGTTTTGAAGSAANVTNSGSTSAAVFNFTIPQGIQGATGATGPQGPNWQVGTGLALNTGTTPNTVAMQSPTPASIPKAGVTDGSNAAAGQVGEYLNGATSSALTVPNAAWTSMGGVLITLTAGDWDVWGTVSYGFTGGLGAAFYCSLSNVLNGTPSNLTLASLDVPHTGASLNPTMMRFSVTANTSIYMNCYATYGAATSCATNPVAVWARRVR